MEKINTGSDVLYTLGWGEYYERQGSGPFIGAPGLDFVALSADYRRERYAEANAAKKDECWLSEGDFSGWLIQKGILRPVECTDVELEIRTSSEEAYVPLHWPECPECQEGRGEKDYGDVRRSLNRIVGFRRCTTCRHEWGHADEPNNVTLPMLADDGRDTEGGCVPFAISKACGVEWETVKAVCAKHGWSKNGMHTPHNAAIAMRELGYELVSRRLPQKGLKPPTLKFVARELGSACNFIIGTRGHWLALVDGCIVDNDNDTGMSTHVVEVFEVRKSQAIAA